MIILVLATFQSVVLGVLGKSLASRVCSVALQASVAGSRTVVGPGPSPPTITETDTGGQIVRAGHKRFFFDLGHNAKGKFLRITEVRLDVAAAAACDTGLAANMHD